MEQMVGFSQQSSGPAHHGNASKLAKIGGNNALSRDRWVVNIKFHVTWNKQIEQSVVVIIAPRWSSGPAPQWHTGLLGDIGKSTVVVVVIQAVFAIVRHVNIWPAAIIVIANGHAESATFVCHARFFRAITTCPVVLVAQTHGSG